MATPARHPLSIFLGVKLLHANQPQTRRPVVEVVLDGFLGRFIRRHQWAGTTIPLPFLAVIVYYGQPDPYTRVHEFHHVAQVENDGLISWWAEYLWDTVAYGYRNNPLEVEAYQAEADAQKNGAPEWAQVQP